MSTPRYGVVGHLHQPDHGLSSFRRGIGICAQEQFNPFTGRSCLPECHVFRSLPRSPRFAFISAAKWRISKKLPMASFLLAVCILSNNVEAVIHECKEGGVLGSQLIRLLRDANTIY